MLGRKQEAISALEKARDYSDLSRTRSHGWVTSTPSAEGKPTPGNMLEELRILESQHQYVSPLHVALIYEGLQEHELALACLEEAFRTRDEYLVYLNIYPEFRRLHADPRFQALLRRIGFFEQSS